MTKHTPGPWRVSDGATVVGPAGNVVAECCGYSDRATDAAQVAQGGRESNARLVAAAPDMLDALERLTHPAADDSDLEHALAVIARARGKAAVGEAVVTRKIEATHYALIHKAPERQQTRQTLSFDGFGINGPDEYRTALAKFTSWDHGQRWGPLFAAAPDLLAALKRLLGERDALSLAAGGGDRWPEAAKAARAAIEAAGG